MDTLKENWLTEGLIDFEYKKFILLAYISSVKKHFKEQKLYPDLAELITHYNLLQSLAFNKTRFSESMPKYIQGMDFKNFLLHYQSAVQDDEVMEEIEKILRFSIPEIKKQMEEGRSIYDFIEQELELYPLGIQPVDLQYGYLFLRNGGDNLARVYEYRLTIFERHDEKYRGIHTRYVTSYTTGINTTYESMKLTLIREAKLLTVPAVYVAGYSGSVPVWETLLPIAKRALVKHLSTM